MNIAEILKGAPKGTKLYSPIFGDVIFEEIRHDYIRVSTNCIMREFHSDGRFYANGECMLFPSRENRDWNTFNYCSFKNGDVIIRNDGIFTAIFSHVGIEGLPYMKTVNYHCWVKNNGTIKCRKDYGIGTYLEYRLATEKEKEFFFKALAEKGFKWNSDTLTLEKLEDKFDTTTLKSFDKVLARDTDLNVWVCRIYSHYRNTSNYKHVCIDNSYIQCIPYNDDTKHLVGITKDCPEYYKTW